MMKNSMLAGIVGATIASAATAAFLCGTCGKSRKARTTVNHAMKNLAHAIDGLM